MKKETKENIVAVLFIINNKKEVLIERKSRNSGGRFAFIMFNTNSIEKEIIDEVYKRLGLKIANLELVRDIKDDDKIYNYYIYKDDVNINKLKLQEDEIDEVKWVSIDGIIDMIQKDTFLENHINMVHIINKYLNA